MVKKEERWVCEFTKNTENNLNMFFNIIRLLGAYYIGVIIKQCKYKQVWYIVPNFDRLSINSGGIEQYVN